MPLRVKFPAPLPRNVFCVPGALMSDVPPIWITPLLALVVAGMLITPLLRVIPPVKEGEASGAFSPTLPLSLSIALRIVSEAVIAPVVEENPVRALPVTVAAAMLVAP